MADNARTTCLGQTRTAERRVSFPTKCCDNGTAAVCCMQADQPRTRPVTLIPALSNIPAALGHTAAEANRTWPQQTKHGQPQTPMCKSLVKGSKLDGFGGQVGIAPLRTIEGIQSSIRSAVKGIDRPGVDTAAFRRPVSPCIHLFGDAFAVGSREGDALQRLQVPEVQMPPQTCGHELPGLRRRGQPRDVVVVDVGKIGEVAAVSCRPDPHGRIVRRRHQDVRSGYQR